MKRILNFLCLMILVTACTEEVEIDEVLNTDVRLVIEANMDFDKTNTAATSKQTIKLSNTSSFYNFTIIPVTGATISIVDKDNVSMGTFLDINPSDVDNNLEDGVYTAVDFITPTVGETYFLTINVNGNSYTAEETLFSVEDVNGIEQEDFPGIEEFIELSINIDNEIGVENFFLFEYENPNIFFKQYEVQDDVFVSEENGKANFDYTYIDELNTNDLLNIRVMGISKNYYNYMNKLITISQGGNGPFSTAPSIVRGNIVNTTNVDDFALGYFSLNQFVSAQHIGE